MTIELETAADLDPVMLDGTLNGTSGWDHQVPCPHDILSTEIAACSTWAQAYAAAQAFMQTGATFPTAPSPGNRQGGSMGNTSQAYAACACAMSRGVAAAPADKAWLDTFIKFNYPNTADASGGIAFYMKCGFDGT